MARSTQDSTGAHRDGLDGRAIDGAYFGPKLLRPARPTLGAARAIARDSDDPQEAWERACAQGLVSQRWVEKSPSVFEADPGAERGHPPTIGHVVAFASDAVAIETATTLGRALARALSAWEVCDPDADVRWTLQARGHWRPRGLHPLILLHARAAMPKASLFDGVRLAFLGTSRDCPGAREVADVLRFAALWRAAAQWTEGPSWQRFSQGIAPPRHDPAAPERWADPWAPVLEILALGYAVHLYERGRIVLVAPSP